MSAPSPMISSYERNVRNYTEADEDSRLRTGYFQLEYERTRELLLRHLPSPPVTIIDVGGGSGTYAAWLSKQGYQVHLIDPVPKHVEQARATSSRQKDYPLASAEIGDARHLPPQDGLDRFTTSSKKKTVCCVCAKPTVFLRGGDGSGVRQ
jgi:ubiquinone/menaquinone biosynthesis C-methylase UbiE